MRNLYNQLVNFALMAFIKLHIFEFHKPIARFYYKQRYIAAQEKSMSCRGTDTAVSFKDFFYKNQNWNDIKWIDRIFFAKSFGLPYFRSENSCDNDKIKVVSSDSIYIDGGREKNNWVFWSSPELHSDQYVISFRTKIQSFLSEYQIAFMHKSISNRLRFLLINNEHLAFEVIRGGFFHDHLISTPFSFKKNKEYQIEITINKETYSFSVDGVNILTVKDRFYRKTFGSIVFIFWDQFGKDKMKLGIKDFSLRELS